MTADLYCSQLKEYRRILDLTREAKDAIQLLDARKEANLAICNGTISSTQEAILCVARGAMRKALHCQTFGAVARLEEAYTQIHADDPLFQGEPRWFFMTLLIIRRMKLFDESPFGNSVHQLFQTHPKLILATIDSRMSVSGVGQ